MLTSISNTPTLNNLKNDFSIWGTRKSISGADIPIHLRYAVDKKPTKYTWSDGSATFTSIDFDYRELIY
jgi:DNA polymerase elongation subunit (family B)